MLSNEAATRPTLLVLASTYPRWRGDHEPAFVHELCHRLASRFQVIALVPDAPGADPSGNLDGVEVHRYRYAPRRLQTLVNDGGIAANLRRDRWKWLLVPAFVLAQYLAARRIVKSRQIDAIHAHWLIPQGLVARLLSCGRRKIPYAVTSHGGDLYGLRGRLLETIKRRVAASASAVTMVSDAMATRATALGIDASAVKVLPMGVDFESRFVPGSETTRSANEILSVGRLVPKKGLSNLLRALPLILEARPETFVTVAGFGPELDRLRSLALELGVSSKIRFAGAIAQQDLPALYRRAAVFVAPFIRDDTGDQEGLPVVVMEAIGCGCPVIVGAVAGVEELLGDFQERMAVEPGNVQALAEAVLRVLDAPEESRKAVSLLRRRVAARCDWRNVSLAYGDLLSDCAHGTGSR